MLKDISGDHLISLLEQTFAYKVTRQAGSHVRLTTTKSKQVVVNMLFG